MAFIKKLGLDKIKDTLESGVQAAQETVSSISVDDAIRGVKDAAADKAVEAGKALESGVESAKEGMANFNKEEAMQAVQDAIKSGTSAIGKAIGGSSRDVPEEGDSTSSLRDYIELLWCLAYADGEVSDAERQTFNELSRALDKDYDSYSAELMQERELEIRKASEEFGNLNAVKIEAQKIVESLQPSPMEAKLICWNMFALAASDGLDDSELDFIRFVGEKVSVDAAVFAEFKNYSDAIVEVERSVEMLKQSGRSYGEIEPLVTEFSKREQSILEAAQALIADR